MNKSLSVNEKIEIYKKAMNGILFGRWKYICLALVMESDIGLFELEFYFPEVFKLKPEVSTNKINSQYWFEFDDKMSRYKILKQAINELQAQVEGRAT